MDTQTEYYSHPNGEKPKVIGREEFLFFADGRRKHVIYNYKDGKEYLAFTEVLTPKVGALHENFRSRHLDFIADYQGFGGDVDVSQAKSSPEYAGDEQVLGYNCAVKRSFLPDGAVVESYDGYNFAAFPLKRVSRNQERVQIWEPTAIELNQVSDAAFTYRSDWPLDFSNFEEQIQRTRDADPGNPQAAQEADRMQQTLEQAKKRLKK